MDQDVKEPQVPLFETSHPWIALQADAEEDDVDEVIRYTLDELRLA